MNKVTMTVYCDGDGFCWIVNVLNDNILPKPFQTIEVSLKQCRKFPYGIQVPVVSIGQFVKRKRTTVNLFVLSTEED
ncbi:hypothetical protein M3_0117 [Lysinibacillus phage vB_LfM_LysYB1]|nr:hypothetical protein M3_0117 [Lysinibacillus phage vB_LfM_LysYB1]WAB25373.1 hypothetical protein M5_0195 [Lysinibacillus phage vB_LfM_LysYB2]